MSTIAVSAGPSEAVLDAGNPFAQESTLPFQAPPFDRIRNEHFMPAFEAGMAQHTAEIQAIANDTAPATFANTIISLESAGALLNRVASAFYTLAGAHTNPEVQQLQQGIAPRLAAHSDSIYLDSKLFGRVKSVYERRDSLSLDPESLRMLELTYDAFVRAGATLGEEDKAKLRVWNQEQSTLQATFLNRILAAMKEGGLHVEVRAALDGLDETEIAAAAEAAQARGLSGYFLTLQNTTQQPALAQLKNRETRKALWQRSLHRCENGEDRDTRGMIARLAQIRAQKAALLGFRNYAEWKLEKEMAGTPEAAIAFLDRLVPPALAGAKAEAAAIQEMIAQHDGGFALEPWDWAFYAEQVRKARYDLNEDEVKPYFELHNVFERGVLYAAAQLYGITFAPRADIPVWHPDVKVYEVFNADDTHLALLYCDFYRRDTKRGGAWMNSLLPQSKLLEHAPIICNICNYTKPPEGEPALLDSDEVRTLFHEFGHALHGMFSEATYPSLSGTAVARDFVEFPSQFNEHWATYPTVFHNYARHYKTDELMPAELQAKLRAAKNFNGGHALTEVLAAAEVDMQWHTLSGDAPLQNAVEFESVALASKGVDIAPVPPRYRSTYFSHIFGGGYAAGYYAYLWAEMLDADAYTFFEANGGLTRENGDRLRSMVLSRGNTADPAEIYRAWRGQDPVIGPLLEQRGIAK